MPVKFIYLDLNCNLVPYLNHFLGVFFQALSAVSKLLVQVPSPFYQLKHVKVPQEHKDSSISADLKRYLLGRSPEATIVTKLPQVVKHPFNFSSDCSISCFNFVSRYCAC